MTETHASTRLNLAGKMTHIGTPSSEALSRVFKMAVVGGVESAVQLHIDRGDNLDARDCNGMTALMLAAARNKSSICRLLLGAGANKDLLSPSGKNAYSIAFDAEAQDVLVLFEELAPRLGKPSATDTGISSEVEPNRLSENEHAPLSRALTAPLGFEEIEVTATYLWEDEPEQIRAENALGFDFLDWEPEDDVRPPEVNPAVADGAGAIQEFISNHEPFDSSEGWDDVEVYLPDASQPLARAEDAEARELLRLLLLRAIREGSVPKDAVSALSLNADGSPNAEAEASLTRVIRDLGAEVDDRFEYVSANENFEVFVNPEETSNESDTLADALALLGNLESRYCDPLRLYQKEFQREKLINAVDEVAFGQAMESALEEALDALAAWPFGIEMTLAAGAMVAARKKPLSWLSTTPTELLTDFEPESLVEDASSVSATVDSNEQTDSVDQDEAHENGDSLPDTNIATDAFADNFSTALGRLSACPVSADRGSSEWRAVRANLAELHLGRQFLSQLAELRIDAPTDTARQYVRAIRRYQTARDGMASANLKLVFHLAKKYLYSGELLDDLAQEGNLGLLKAIDRYDWRRGFKFSTYATWWIRQNIGRHIADKCRTIRLPVYIYEQAQKISREAIDFEAQHGRAPEINELAAKLNFTVRKVSEIRRIAPEPLSMDDLSVDEVIAPDAQSYFFSADPLESAMNSQTRAKVSDVLATLKKKEEQVIRFRYGIGVSDALTLEEVGQCYQVTRERVRQIEAKALGKLMQPSRADPLLRVFSGRSVYEDAKAHLEQS